MIAHFVDPDFGTVEVHLRRGMRRLIVKWKDNHLLVTAPQLMSGNEIIAAFNALKPQLLSFKRPAVSYHLGQVITCLGCSVTISCDLKLRKGICSFGRINPTEFYIHMPEGADFQSFSAQKTISEMLKKLMRRAAGDTLIPLARQVAAELGVACGSITLGRGMKKLGHCSLQKDIQLSSNLMFLPEHLVRYVICHELAHVTHLNHSAAFHALVNEYVDGKERELERELRAFSWPILRY